MAIVDIQDIVNMLTDRLEALCADVLPMGRREGRDWVEASTSRGGLGDGLKVCLQGARRGVFRHFGDASNAKGDALELIAYVMCNGDKAKAIAYAKDFLGLEKADQGALKRSRAKAAANAKKREAAHQKEIEKKQRGAKAMWLEANPQVAGTPVDFYLLGRGIGLGDLPRVPGGLRYAPRLRHKNGQYYPAMVAAITTYEGVFTAVHRTYLQIKGDAIVMKAPLGNEAKMVYGPYAGGYIALSRGSSNRKYKDAPADDHLVLCEGIEDGLTIALCRPDLRVHACVSVSNFQNQRLPQNIREVTIAADNDDPASPAGRALQSAIDRFMDDGRRVYVARSEQGKDYNDWLRAGEKGAA